MSGPAPFDWPALMRAGISGLGLRPADFWDLTPAELMLMLGPGGPVPATSATLASLIDAYPDTPKP